MSVSGMSRLQFAAVVRGVDRRLSRRFVVSFTSRLVLAVKAQAMEPIEATSIPAIAWPIGAAGWMGLPLRQPWDLGHPGLIGVEIKKPSPV